MIEAMINRVLYGFPKYGELLHETGQCVCYHLLSKERIVVSEYYFARTTLGLS